MAQPRPRSGVNLGDVVPVDFAMPTGSEAGYRRRGVVVTTRCLPAIPPIDGVRVPLTSTRRSFPSFVEIAADSINGLEHTSWALVEQLRAVAVERCGGPAGNIGPAVTHRLLDIRRVMTAMP